MNMLALAVMGKCFSTLFFFMSWWLYKPPVDHSKPVNVSNCAVPQDTVRGNAKQSNSTCLPNYGTLLSGDTSAVPTVSE